MSSSSDKKREKPISRASAPILRPRRLAQRPSVAVEFERDGTSITSMQTPAPLPPVPGEHHDDAWFEQLPTNPPPEIPDLGAMAGGTDPGSLPGWARDPRRKSVSGLPDVPEHSGPGSRIRHPTLDPPIAIQGQPLNLAMMAICLVVGLAAGAFLHSLFGAHGDTCPDPTVHPAAESAPSE